MPARLCELCRTSPAEFIVSRVVGADTRQERRLCASCAASSERVHFGDKGLQAVELLRSMLADDCLAHDGINRTKVCPGCGNTLDETRETGALGCSMCYVVFRDEVDNLIAGLHGYAPGPGKPG